VIQKIKPLGAFTDMQKLSARNTEDKSLCAGGAADGTIKMWVEKQLGEKFQPSIKRPGGKNTLNACIVEIQSLKTEKRQYNKTLNSLTQLTNGSLVAAWSDKTLELFEEFELKTNSDDCAVACAGGNCTIF